MLGVFFLGPPRSVSYISIPLSSFRNREYLIGLWVEGSIPRRSVIEAAAAAAAAAAATEMAVTAAAAAATAAAAAVLFTHLDSLWRRTP